MGKVTGFLEIDRVDRRYAPSSQLRLAFSFGTNDCTSENTSGPRLSHDTTLINARRILKEASSRGPTIMLGPPPVLDNSVVDDRIRRLSGDLGSMCAEVSIPFLETFDFVLACPAWRREAVEGDGAHPNREGYAAVAAFVWEWPGFRGWTIPDL